MIDRFLTKLFGTPNQRYLKSIRPLIERINALEPEMQQLSDEEMRARTIQFKERVANAVAEARDAEERKRREQAILNELLPEAFALVREASVRTTGMRHFDVQLIGGIVLHEGKIAEMKTGEGKTLVATLPAYLNALTGRGVHIVTVNDYLASRDAEWMGKIYKHLGLTVGCIQNDMDDWERKDAYAADITYGTNNEFGFDYLRDNMKFDLATCVQRGHYYAIVDEVDSILIDEARTPLIISGPSEEATDKYYKADAIIPHLKRGEKLEDGRTTGDYIVDEKQHTVVLTEEGIAKAERLLGVGNLYDPSNMEMLHCVEQALRAHTLYKRDHHYVVQDGQVIIVDEFTGRLMHGRRWSDGLHQAVEAKEGVKIERENQTLATITLQNYFRLYEKLAGMTGTAETEAAEFQSTYNLDVIVIPTHKPMIRVDHPDVIYRTLPEKWDAVIEEIKDCYERGQPVLVGTVSVENSELLSRRLQRLGIPHNVLNAKPENAAREAEIVAQAGRKGAVTIATNMAGRGTDILLGGNPEFLAREFLKRDEINPDEATPEQWEAALKRAKEIVEKEHEEVVKLGGLHIVGTERHESRRIDNQLRGRAGRQGDPGSSRFFLSLEDDLMRIFAGDRVRAIMQKLGMEKGVAIESKMVSKRIEAAQKSVEARNFEIRKHLLQYDDVMNKQRETIYGLRRQLMAEPDHREYILGIARDLLSDLTKQYLDPDVSPDEWDIADYKAQLKSIYGFDADAEGIDFERMNSREIEEAIWQKLEAKYAEKEAQVGPEAMRTYERIIMLNIIDAQWKDHLLAIDHLKQGIGLVGYGQKDPLVEYKKESFALFEAMLDRIDMNTVRALFNLQVVSEQAPEALQRRRMSRPTRMTFTGPNQGAAAAGEEAAVKTVRRDHPKVGRNDPCPCGSGKKYKKCCGA
ncbi:preprotein translocase subunit SecA [Pyrinomonas methylaliphatogenes]|jgi:preprotein translocase subunit SecA|uniref:Protein translocase subunit SecA n=1 Tax=Pyrinomonas methylaliphatogenes TaxID=454194 RepID=A0A0B6WV84_9BACT|nr:preprotein translocase subunit SecA [Pyrinomonas methylaliphatogenes]CDM64672.1 protein translocase subunit secA [Pyrinomonas methylaliphatogenes]